MNETHAVISAFLDDEPFDAADLAAAGRMLFACPVLAS